MQAMVDDESRRLLEDHFDSRARRRKRRGLALALVLAALLPPLAYVSNKTSQHMEAVGRLGTLGILTNYTFDGLNWKAGGETSLSVDRYRGFLRRREPADGANFANLHNVVSLDLSEADREDLLDPTFIADLPELRILWADRTRPLWEGAPKRPPFKLDFLAILPNLRKLRMLELSGVRIQDRHLATIAQIRNLEELDLSSTLVTDKGLAKLKGLRNLKLLQLSGSHVTAAGVQALRASMPGVMIEYDQAVPKFHSD